MIQFKKVILHNFGSYSHTELDLQNRGFCMVSGKNNYIKDNALSNGSGKSFLWSAICYALTGETINGIKTNLKNINIEESECYVQLELIYKGDLFTITRIIAPKSDLKIIRNDIDLSGKGIRESEKKLHEIIPDLTKDFIASTIIIGQGMPNKFSSFSPSGRKELLEKLTKSDFMIEDLKVRIQSRQQELNSKIREFDDSLVANKTLLNTHLARLDKIKETLEAQQNTDFDQLITEQTNKINLIQQKLSEYKLVSSNLENQIEKLNTDLLEVTNEKAEISTEELKAYTESHTKLISEKTKLEFTITSLKKEITRLQAITDICPTCGQLMPDIHKPDTSEQEASLSESIVLLNDINDKVKKCNKQHNEYLAQIDSAFKDKINTLNENITEAKQNLHINEALINDKIANLTVEQNLCNKLIYDKQNWQNFITNELKEKDSLEEEVARLTNLVAITSLSREELGQRVAIVKKMDLLTRRDFRGYLLTNIISYIDSRAKVYCETVFGTKELSLNLNGNALDITYCGKLFDSLSGGEKQRVDLILQLAIRDLLTTYLNLSANILVLDEITDFLDKKSCQSIMKLLEKELQTTESVFIISHHAEELELPIDSEIKIIKNEHGISELC